MKTKLLFVAVLLNASLSFAGNGGEGGGSIGVGGGGGDELQMLVSDGVSECDAIRMMVDEHSEQLNLDDLQLKMQACGIHRKSSERGPIGGP